MARRKSIASLGVTLVARTSDFKKRMKAAKAITRRFSAGMFNAAKKIGKFSAAIIGAGTAIATVLIKQQLTAIDRLAKQAEKFGILNKELSELRLAAKFAGVPIKSLDVGLQRFGRRLSEAAAGNVGLQATFRELGLDPVRLQTMGVADAFKALTPAFRKQALATNRVRLAFKLFDTEGVDLVNLMVKGSEAFKQAEKDVHQFGLVVSQVAGEQVQAANDSFTTLGEVMTGAFRQAAIAITPFAKAISDHLIGVARDGDAMEVRIQKTFETVVLFVGNSIQKIVGFFDDLRLAFKVVSDVIADIGDLPFIIADAFGLGGLTGISTEGLNAASRERAGETAKFRHEAKQRQGALDPQGLLDSVKAIAAKDVAEAQATVDQKLQVKEDARIEADKVMTNAFRTLSIAMGAFPTIDKQPGRSRANPMSTEAPDVVAAIKGLSDIVEFKLTGGGVAL